MLSPSDFREIVSGRRKGLRAALWRALLRTIEWPYTWEVSRRNRRFDSGKTEIVRLDTPVVSVGNLTLGGTGKTPMVEWLARWFVEQGVKLAIVSRGYGAAAGESNDEAKELAEKLPDVPHVLNRQRAVGALQAIKQYGAQLILLDDGFQHRQLGRDLDIVLVDALEPFGFEQVFPRGTLREPLAGFARAQVIALSRADAVDSDTRRAIQARIRSFNPTATWLELSHAPQAVRRSDGNRQPLDHLKGKRLLAFCGIGNPIGFRKSLEHCGYEIMGFREFPDHHAYQPADLLELASHAERAQAEALICTHKDLVKIAQPTFSSRPLWALEIGLKILTGQEEFSNRLNQVTAQIKRAEN